MKDYTHLITLAGEDGERGRDARNVLALLYDRAARGDNLEAAALRCALEDIPDALRESAGRTCEIIERTASTWRTGLRVCGWSDEQIDAMREYMLAHAEFLGCPDSLRAARLAERAQSCRELGIRTEQITPLAPTCSNLFEP